MADQQPSLWDLIASVNSSATPPSEPATRPNGAMNALAMLQMLTPEERAKYLAALQMQQQAMFAPQAPQAAAPTRLSITPAMAAAFNPPAPGPMNPMAMRPNSGLIDRMEWLQKMNELSNIGR